MLASFPKRFRCEDTEDKYSLGAVEVNPVFIRSSFFSQLRIQDGAQ